MIYINSSVSAFLFLKEINREIYIVQLNAIYIYISLFLYIFIIFLFVFQTSRLISLL